MTHNERRFQLRLFNHLFRIVPVSWVTLVYIAGDRRQNVKPKFAQVPEQSDFTYGVYLVAAEHLKPSVRSPFCSMSSAGYSGARLLGLKVLCAPK